MLQISKFGLALCGSTIFFDLDDKIDNPIVVSTLFTLQGD